MEIPEIFKSLRQEKGLTQKELAAKLGIGQSTVNGYEKGNREPIPEIIKAYSKYFGVSADYLLGIEDDFSENVSHVVTAGLNDKEAEIIKNYRLSNDVGKTAIEITAESFAQKATSISKERRA